MFTLFVHALAFPCGSSKSRLVLSNFYLRITLFQLPFYHVHSHCSSNFFDANHFPGFRFIPRYEKSFNQSLRHVPTVTCDSTGPEDRRPSLANKQCTRTLASATVVDYMRTTRLYDPLYRATYITPPPPAQGRI